MTEKLGLEDYRKLALGYTSTINSRDAIQDIFIQFRTSQKSIAILQELFEKRPDAYIAAAAEVISCNMYTDPTRKRTLNHVRHLFPSNEKITDAVFQVLTETWSSFYGDILKVIWEEVTPRKHTGLHERLYGMIPKVYPLHVRFKLIEYMRQDLDKTSPVLVEVAEKLLEQKPTAHVGDQILRHDVIGYSKVDQLPYNISRDGYLASLKVSPAENNRQVGKKRLSAVPILSIKKPKTDD